ncbi:MAG: carbonic anhydrase [Acidobacteriaceae bacterium]|nr:carbonic anhydrase [Acidobacteriaceae bacterium]
MFPPEVQQSRNRLLIGLHNFQTKVYPEKQADYQRLVREGQSPDTLFITCADSRVDPELLTQSGPGEIFVSRNIGNLIPAYGELLGGISALLEYAVAALRVHQVVVCGHTDCGAMKALIHPEKVESMPTVKRWLRNAEAALSTVRARATAADETDLVEQLIEENVLLQMNHLRTHPAITGRLAQKSLAIFGWVYDIAHGQVRIFDEQQHKFLTFDGSNLEVQASAGIS